MLHSILGAQNIKEEVRGYPGKRPGGRIGGRRSTRLEYQKHAKYIILAMLDYTSTFYKQGNTPQKR